VTESPTDPVEPGDQAGEPGTAARRRLRDRVFGDVLPETTEDERGPGAHGGGNDEWLRSNVPPHHG
jgi:hypothetical protein